MEVVAEALALAEWRERRVVCSWPLGSRRWLAMEWAARAFVGRQLAEQCARRRDDRGPVLAQMTLAAVVAAVA